MPYFSSIDQKCREKRFNFFLKFLSKIDSGQLITILDIGGTVEYWKNMNFTDRKNVYITLLNLKEFLTDHPNFTSVIGDARNLQRYSDNEFHLVYSNSVIEHLFSFENQKLMANEVKRVGKNHYIQNPNYFPPIEPHWRLPFFQYLPFKMRVFMDKYFSLGNYTINRPRRQRSRTYKEAFLRVSEIKLLSEKEMKSLFPESKVYREKFLGFTKSITMYHFPE
ncbi:MAG: class I SAM-dependent methyltransferase [Ekhidna sp.]|nr:class I SAM-dependent methyltransferase [Ekhidna sp.]